jgi:hypothetical protein
MLVSQDHYILSTLSGQLALRYKAQDTALTGADHRALAAWFLLNQYVPTQVYHLLGNGTEGQQDGYSFYLLGGNLHVRWMSTHLVFPVSVTAGTWYAIVVNVEQQQRTVSFALYKRRTPSSEKSLELVASGEQPLLPEGYFAPAATLHVLGSDLRLTNLRLYRECIPAEAHNQVLNQYVVRDLAHVIVADNAARQVITPEHKY